MTKHVSRGLAARRSRSSPRLIPALALLCLAGYVFVYATGRAGPPIRSDGFSYYVYLPSWFVYGDTSLAAVADDCCGGAFPEFTAIIRWPQTGRWVDAHPIGVALMQAPLFLAAHALSHWSNLSADGFTLYYQHAAGLSGLICIVGGLYVLQQLLDRHFSRGVVMATLVALLLGTNLYHYATFDSSYSHPYSFFLVATLLDLTERWHCSPTRQRSVLIGIVAGLILLTRHTNILFLATIPLFGAATRGWRGTTRFLWERRRALMLILLITGAMVAPQLALYYRATGQLLVSSYGSLGFTFASPHLAGVLFSVQKGLFFWSPLLVLAVAGLFMLQGQARAFLLTVACVLAADTFVIASWWDWQFGASYGHRGFVDLLPLMALGLAAFFQWTARQRARTIVVSMVVVMLVSLSVLQMLQYWNGILPHSDTTWTQYRALFLRL